MSRHGISGQRSLTCRDVSSRLADHRDVLDRGIDEHAVVQEAR
jgi:hypothetical protein